MSKKNKLSIGGLSAEDLIKQYGSPLYVYDAAIIERQYASLVHTITYPKLKIHFACKSNTNVEILKLLKKAGSGIETVSPGEILAAEKAGFAAKDIVFTSSNISREELAWVMKKGIIVNLDSLIQLKLWGEMNPHSTISIRLNQGIGAGHHKMNITGGPDSKFGIDLQQVDEVKKIAKKYHLIITNLHQHIGSGILDEGMFMKAMEKLLETAMHFSDLAYLDFGGGFGVPYHPTDKPLAMESLGGKITNRLNTFMKAYGRELSVKFEPGRYLVAESGFLLTTVVDVKKTPSKIFVGIDSGFNHFIRPMMYGSYHAVVNASRVIGKQENVWVVGNICESGDIFGKNRLITKCTEGDILAIANTGAYGYTMASDYSSRPKPAEVLIEDGKARLIRERKGV